MVINSFSYDTINRLHFQGMDSIFFVFFMQIVSTDFKDKRVYKLFKTGYNMVVKGVGICFRRCV